MIPSHRSYLITLVFSILLFGSALQAQDIEAILAIQEVDTMLYSGPKDNRINWVIQNRGNSFADKGEFTSLYRNDLLLAFEPGHPQAQAPYAQYRNFFNLYTYWWPDAPDEGSGWTFGIIKALRDAIFLPWANNETGWATFFSTTRHGGGGGAGLDRAARVGDGKMYGMGWETFLHEFGHTMPGLLDEYSADGSWSNGQCWETPNTTGQLDIDNIPWRRWIREGTPLPTPYTEEYLNEFGAFEGAMTNYFGCHRPTARGCFMGAGGFGEEFGQTLCSPCIQRVICYLYQYVHVIENPQPVPTDLYVTGAETITFSADIIHPEPNTQQYRWMLNGKVISTDASSVDITFGHCDTYEVVLEVLDTNTLVRYDPDFEHIYPRPIQRRTWTVHQDDVSSYSLTSSSLSHPVDCHGEASGGVEFAITGGQSPYSIYLNGVPTSNPASNLAAGAYSFDIIDANGCRVTNEVSIDADLPLDPRICSSLNSGHWVLSVDDLHYDSTVLSYLWSTGATDHEITVTEDGTYFVDITTDAGCTVRRTIDLLQSSMALEVQETHFPTSANAPTGKIYLDISKGRPPYTISWEEKVSHDLTSTETSQIISSGTTWGHEPEYAFDNSLSTKWLHAISEGAYIGYRFSTGEVINYYVITSADDVPERDPRNWEFQGSMNGTDWETLDQQQDHQFSKRFERRGFRISNSTPYAYYRLYVLQNYGDIATQIQELEFAGVRMDDPFTSNHLAQNLDHRSQLGAGLYRCMVKDANGIMLEDTIQIVFEDAFTIPDLKVVKNGDCQVAIEFPDPDLDYYWFTDEEASRILHIGETFRPIHSGNYYVGGVDQDTRMLGSNLKGFAVRVAETPLAVELINTTELSVADPDPMMRYAWYDQDQCGTPIHIGTTFSPGLPGTYYVSAQFDGATPEPIDPSSISGLIVRMDASDLDGDLIVDNPSPPTGSMYDWVFSNGNAWADFNWFAFRSNYQNGLGIADFATIWLQRIRENESGYQTILLAYQENPLSFPGKAPFEGLSRNIPRHSDASQIYSSSAPDRTINGSTYLNGELIDPFSTPNPMEFCILGTVMTEPAQDGIFYTDTHWEGKIGEVILFDRPLTEEEMQGASAYLKDKWLRVAELESPRKELHWDGVILGTDPDSHLTDNLILFPNPTSGTFRLQGPDGKYSVELYNQAGMLLKQYASGSDFFNISGYPDGIYLVRVFSYDSRKTWVRSLVKTE